MASATKYGVGNPEPGSIEAKSILAPVSALDQSLGGVPNREKRLQPSTSLLSSVISHRDRAENSCFGILGFHCTVASTLMPQRKRNRRGIEDHLDFVAEIVVVLAILAQLPWYC